MRHTVSLETITVARDDTFKKKKKVSEDHLWNACYVLVTILNTLHA